MKIDVKKLQLDPAEVWAVVPKKIQKRRGQFVIVPIKWYERLEGAAGQTYRVALWLLFLHWQNGGNPVKLPNGMLAMDGVPSETKRRALRELEERGLVTVEWQNGKSPVVRLVTSP